MTGPERQSPRLLSIATWDAGGGEAASTRLAAGDAVTESSTTASSHAATPMASNDRTVRVVRRGAGRRVGTVGLLSARMIAAGVVGASRRREGQPGASDRHRSVAHCQSPASSNSIRMAAPGAGHGGVAVQDGDLETGAGSVVIRARPTRSPAAWLSASDPRSRGVLADERLGAHRAGRHRRQRDPPARAAAPPLLGRPALGEVARDPQAPALVGDPDRVSAVADRDLGRRGPAARAMTWRAIASSKPPKATTSAQACHG